MSEHSKGPELRYDAEKGEIRRGRELMADVYLPCGPYGPAIVQRDALGRKMAASVELVEVVLRLLGGVGAQVNGGGHAAYHTEADVQVARAALEKAGVKP